ncbi:lysophospholipid acyltransferase family protein [Stenoxybacter acetivorans]|uniref:lysophospholipid acyltransferase family protein n=1 Tax=Stenoxybacter acetivorans TaxID=422441 RepID=UPI0012EB7445|nr:lysophospholipid acyltransferase family protein [Stenoxybacter acetivorans]
MIQKPIYLLFALAASLPLPFLHNLGSLFGLAGFYLGKKTRARITKNVHSSKLAQSNQAEQNLIKAVCRESMKSGLELPIAWTRSTEYIVSLFKQTHGLEHLQAALNNKQGILLITPHLGSYDLAGRFLSEQLPFPLTAMYRPPKLRWLENVMNAGRVRDNGRTAPATLQGVKQIVRALKQGEATIILPDQFPKEGDGVWVHFLNQPAYTMTLAAKLANLPNVSTLFFCGERLPHGQGFALHIAPLSGSLTGDKKQDTQLINNNAEHWIARFPEQYLFGYNRFKGNPPADMREQTMPPKH